MEKPKSPKPTVLPNPDFSHLIKMVEEGLYIQMRDCWEDDDFKHHVYEKAMTAIYGNDFFKWRNQQDWAR